MKLTLLDKWEIELDDGTKLNGEIKRLNKKEKAEIEKKFAKDRKITKDLNKLAIEAQKIERRLKAETDNEKISKFYDRLDEIQEQGEKLAEQLDKLDTIETTAEYRISTSVQSKNMKELLDICEEYSYDIVLRTILKDVEEKMGNGMKS